MRQRVAFFTVFYLASLVVSMTCYGQRAINFNGLPLNETEKNQILKMNSIVHSKMRTDKSGKKQKFDFHITRLHTKSCRFALRKLKQYEEYENYVSIIEKSTYNDKTKDFLILLDPPVISMKLIIDFKVDRIETPGIYPYTFEKGFLNGLEGEVHISEHKKQCLFHIWAKWEGKKTRFPDKVIELFTAAAAKISVNRLAKISSIY